MEDLIEIDLSGEIEFDLDSLLQSSGDDAVVSPEPSFPDGAVSENSDSQGSAFSWMSEIEKFLSVEDADAGGEDFGPSDDFFSELFADGSEGVEDEPAASQDADAPLEREKRDASLLVDAEDEDPIGKKRRRQMRNRDSAMKSRERKKTYLKDLETKSRYLESECRRLDYALRCCETENIALRQRLMKGRPFGASTAKQESAVLFVESLLLGSLFWLVSIVCLFLLPGLPVPNPKDSSRLARGLAREVTKRLTTKRVVSVIMRRRCRGTRTRMKLCLFPLHAISA